MDHHNSGNQYAKKEVVKKSWIQIRCTQEQKAQIVNALYHEEKLSEFMLDAAQLEVDRRNK